MGLVAVNIVNKSGGKVGFTLDEERDAERINHLKSLVRREELESVKVESLKARAKTRTPDNTPPGDVPRPLAQMTAAELKAYAAAAEPPIDLGNATKASEIRAVIEAEVTRRAHGDQPPAQ